MLSGTPFRLHAIKMIPQTRARGLFNWRQGNAAEERNVVPPAAAPSELRPEQFPPRLWLLRRTLDLHSSSRHPGEAGKGGRQVPGGGRRRPQRSLRSVLTQTSQGGVSLKFSSSSQLSKRQPVVPPPRQCPRQRRQTADGSARKPEKGRRGFGHCAAYVQQRLAVLLAVILPRFMSSQEAADCNALEATTSIEEITGDEHNRDILRSLQNDEVSELWLCRPGLASASEDYELSNSRELDWLGHFAKKSTRLESVGIFGDDIFGNCSGHSVDRFLNDLGKCNHIKKMHFAGADLAEIIDKVGGAMKSNNFTQFFVDECYLGVPEATFVFNSFREMISLEELRIDGIEEEEELANLNDGTMASCIPSLAACTG
ncbi:hypothetical protein THAOC_27447, partial [Thalassiosira oceanica]